jgi:hypothetical protein
MIKFQYIEDGSLYIHEFIFWQSTPNAVDVRFRLKEKADPICYTAWSQDIVNDEIVWRKNAEEFLHLTPGAIDYISRIVKLKAFW